MFVCLQCLLCNSIQTQAIVRAYVNTLFSCVLKSGVLYVPKCLVILQLHPNRNEYWMKIIQIDNFVYVLATALMIMYTIVVDPRDPIVR